MYLVTAPISTDLATAIEPYRQKFDPLATLMPPHITVIRPFRLSGPQEELVDHFSEVGTDHAPIKVSLAGWDASNQNSYSLHLPIIGGRQELTALRNDLLSQSVHQPAAKKRRYRPRVVFGRFADRSDLERAKKSLKGFEPQFVFRIFKFELWQQETPDAPWQIEKEFGLEATVTGLVRN